MNSRICTPFYIFFLNPDYVARENSRPSSLPARVAFRVKDLHGKHHSGWERRRTAFAGY